MDAENQDEINNLLTELKNQIKEASEILDILRPLTANAEIHKSIFDEIVTKFEKTHSEITASKSANTKYLNDLKSTKDEINTFIDASKSNISEIKTIISAVKMAEWKAKKWSENIETLTTQANLYSREIREKKLEIEKLFKKLNTLHNNGVTSMDKLRADETSGKNLIKALNVILNQAKTNTNELEKYYKRWKDSFSKIELQSKKIDNFEQISSENNSKIQEFFDKLISGVRWKEPIKKEIDNILTKIKSHQEQIDQQLQNSASNRLCIAFKDKEEKLQSEVNYWKWMVFILTFILIVVNIWLMLIGPILNHFNITFHIDPWQHVGIILPLAILLWFSILEHWRLKQILDEYSFKYISAFSMPAYHELLETRSEEKSTNFLINTIERIYQSPSSRINSRSKTTMVDYVFDFFKEFKGYFKKDQFSMPEMPDIKASVGDYNIQIVKKGDENKD